MSKDIQEVRETFKHFDKDGNGSIDSAELGKLMKALGAEVDEQVLKVGLDALDADGNGRIDFDEFAEWWADR